MLGTDGVKVLVGVSGFNKETGELLSRIWCGGHTLLGHHSLSLALTPPVLYPLTWILRCWGAEGGCLCAPCVFPIRTVLLTNVQLRTFGKQRQVRRKKCK